MDSNNNYNNNNTIDKFDQEYEDLCQAEKRVCRWGKKNNFRVIDVLCCATCKSHISTYEGYDCKLMAKECDSKGWDIHQVSALGICDRYEKEILE